MKILKILFPLVAVMFMGSLVKDNWGQISQSNWTLNGWVLMMSLFLLVIFYYLDAICWYSILKSQQQKITLWQAVSIWIQSSLSRYIPGVIWAYSSRIFLAREKGVPGRVCMVSMLLENILLVLSSFTVGFPLLWYTCIDKFFLFVIVLSIMVFLWLTYSGIFLKFKIYKRLHEKYFSEFVLPGKKTFFQLFLFYVLFWLLFSSLFAVTLFSIKEVVVTPYTFFYTMSAFASSFCLGIILIVFPGGIGVRELGLYAILITIIPPPIALVISIGSRLWLIVGELLTFSSWMIARRFVS